ncbi:VanZ family protein [Priestia aryabhattai]|uniref:VanZ family protein n=1 Tax=Priestia aryabhattai TaxID=412384 RepID=UPI003D277D28
MLKRKLILINVLFLGSFLFIMVLTMFPDKSLGIGGGRGGINLVPFYKIRDLLLHHSFVDFAKNILGNIVLFMPFGFLLPIVLNNMNNLLRVCLVGILLSTSIECIQLFMPDRWTDIDDVILNVLGAGMGYTVFKKISEMYKIKVKTYM